MARPGERATTATSPKEFGQLDSSAGGASTIGPKRPGDQRLAFVELLVDVSGRQMYRAYDQQLRREVRVVRIVRAKGVERSVQTSAAQILAALSHPNVLTIYDIDVDREGVWLTTEAVRGEVLPEWLSSQPRTWTQVARVFAQTARALAAGHAAGVEHRTLSADSVYIDDSGNATIVDMGFAALERPDWTPSDLGSEPDTRQLCNLLAELDAGRLYTTDRPTRETAAPQQTRPRGRTPRCIRLLAQAGDSTTASPGPTPSAIAQALERVARPRRRFGAITFATALASAAALYIWPSTDAAQPSCELTPKRLSATWNNARSELVADHFSSHGPSWSATLWPVARASIDGYALAWKTTHTEICVAVTREHTLAQELFDRSMSCLDERLAELDGVLTLLSNAETEVLKKATQLTDSLTPVTACGDERYLTARVKPPTDPNTKAKVAELGTELAGIRRFVHVGPFARGLAELDRIAPAIEATEYSPLAARARYLRGILEGRNGDTSRARELVHDAYLRSLSAGDDELSLLAASEYAFSLAEHADDHRAARWWIRHAESLRERGYYRPEVLAHVEKNAGVVYLRTAEYDVSLEHMNRAITLHSEVFGPNHASVVASMVNKAVLLSNQQDFQGARDLEKQAFQRLTAKYGEHHPLACWLGNNGADGHIVDGEYAEAAQKLDHILPICVSVLGDRHFIVGAMYNARARALLELRQFKLAHHTAKAIVARNRESTSEPDRDHAYSLALLGRAELELGDRETATIRLREAVSIYVATPSPTKTASEAHAWFALARATWDATPEEAITLAARAREIVEKPAVNSADGQRLLAQIDRWQQQHSPPPQP